MQNNEKFNKVIEAMQRSELDPRNAEHLRVFLFSIMGEPRFEKIINLMNDKPEVFDLFAKCFGLKVRFLEHGGDQAQWQYVLESEKELLELLNTYKK